MMLVTCLKRLPVLLVLLIALTTTVARAQANSQFAFLLVRPATPDSKLKPYVIQITQNNEAFGLIFPESVRVTLFTPQNSPFYLQVNPIIPHTPSGGYRLVDTVLWSAFAYDLDGTNAPDLNDPAFNKLKTGKLVDSSLLVGTRPQVVNGKSEILIITPAVYKPVTSGQRYDACTTQEDVKGVMVMDFSQDDLALPDFQIVQLGNSPIRIRIPSLAISTEFIAVANNVDPNGAQPGITRYTLSGDLLGPYILLERRSFAVQDGSSGSPNYKRLYEALDRSKAQIFPLSAVVAPYNPDAEIIQIVFKGAPECRNLTPGKTTVTPIDGTPQQGLGYVINGRESDGIASTLKLDRSVIIRAVNPDGRICFDDPNPPANTKSPNLVCANGWQLMEKK